MNRFTLTLAAATTVTALGLVPMAFAATSESPSPRSTASLVNTPASTVDSAGIQNVLATVTNDALTRNDLSNLVANFTTADRGRIQKSATYSEGFGSKLDGRIEQINQAWKQKYGHDFDIRSAGSVYGASFASIQQGNARSDPALAQEVCGSASASASASAANASQNHAMAENNTQNNTMKNQELAVVTLQAMGSHSAMRVPLMQEGSQWRLHAPASLDASTLRQNLLNHLTHIGQNSSKWPANESQAYQAVTRSVLAAILEQGNHATAMTPAHTPRASG